MLYPLSPELGHLSTNRADYTPEIGMHSTGDGRYL